MAPIEERGKADLTQVGNYFLGSVVTHLVGVHELDDEHHESVQGSPGAHLAHLVYEIHRRRLAAVHLLYDVIPLLRAAGVG